MSRVEPRDHLIAWSSAAAVVAGVALFALQNAVGLEDPASHLSSHLAFGLPAAALLFFAATKWPPPFQDRWGRAARTVLVVGLGVLAAGQLGEGVGAFGFDGNRRVNALASLHDVALSVGLLGLLVLMLGVGLTALVAAARRFGLIGTRWMGLLVGAAVAGVVLFVLGSLVFGY